MLRVCNFRQILAGATGTLLLSALPAIVHAQEAKAINVEPTDYDRHAVSEAQNARHHARPANTEAGKAARPTEISNMHSAAAAPAAAAPDSGGLRYPADLQYHNGPVVTSMRQTLIYVNLNNSPSCSTVATCWGNPRGFLSDLGQSNMIHIVDQYVGSVENGRYRVSEEGVRVSYPLSVHPYTDNDMLAIVHAVVTQGEEHRGTGYDHEYHIFLVPGQDECFDSTYSVCYSPDNLPTFFFCAYHGSADFKDIGHVLYSVEPFQNVRGCRSRPNGPNGPVVDSTNNVLSHETFETITDPDGTAWWNSLDNGLYGQEIGDECSFLVFIAPHTYFDPSDVTLNGRSYAIQPEADNAQHACSTTPP
jgi:hypothetical protein